jgi:hypothetical protein
MSIQVVNIKTYRPGGGRGAYIGRAMPGRPGSPLGNPFKLRFESERAEILAKYEAWLRDRIETVETVRREIERLVYLARDEDLALLCWCKRPDRDVACHGDVIKAIIEERLSARRKSQ